jgi:hypothetical protein
MNAVPPDPGLCKVCRHHAWIRSGRGSLFLRCNLSFSDPRFPKYPPLPVLVCDGFARGDGEERPDPGRED